MAKKPKRKLVTKAKKAPKIDPIVKNDKKYRDLNYVAAPKDVKEALKKLYIKRKKAAKKSGKKFVPPSLKDVKQYTKIVSNEANPRFYMYWDLTNRMIDSKSESFFVMGLDGKVKCKSCNLSDAIIAVNKESKIIDEARKILGIDSEIAMIPFITYKKKVYGKKGLTTVVVKIDFSQAEMSDALKEIIKTLI